MRLKVYVNDADYSASVLATSVEISKSVSDVVSSASLTFQITGDALGARYDEARYDEAFYGVDVRELYDIRIEDADTGVRQFGGQISRIAHELKRNGTAPVVALQCDCSDYTWILERTNIGHEVFENQTDRQIIQYLINKYCPQVSALTANIQQIATIGYLELTNESVRQAIQKIREYTGAEWRVDFSKALHYFQAESFTAAFGLSSEPNHSTTFPIDAVTKYSKDFIRPVNKCTVLGGFLPGGTQIAVTADDPLSQIEYGIHAITIVDREIALPTDALLRAQATVAELAYPQEAISLDTFRDGLDIGQTIPVRHRPYAIDGEYFIHSMRMVQIDSTTTRYSLQLGVREPDENRLLRMLEARSRRGTQTPTAVPAPGSVTNTSLGEPLNAQWIGTVNANSIVGLINAGQINTVTATQIVGLLQATQIGTVNAGTVQGVMQAHQIGTVNATSIQGVILSQQVADSLIDRLSMYANALRPIPTLTADPALPSTNHPEGSFYYNRSTGTFRRVTGGVWTNSTESAAVSGRLEFYHIGTIKAGSIIGLIAAAQIENITAGQIIGAITAGQIASVNASAISGTLTATQIASVNASAILGTLTASQISTVNATSITGTLSSSQIGTIFASQISGTFTASQIASVNASAINGTVTASQIGSVNAGTITIGLIQNSQISSMSASKLTAGTIDANTISVINLNASNITTGAMSASRLSFGSFSGSGTTLGMNSTGFLVTNSLGRSAALGADQLAFTGGVGGSTLHIGAGQILINGLNVVGPRQAAVASPSGGSLIDLQARAAIDQLRARLQSHGLIAA